MKTGYFANGGRAWFVRFRNAEGCQMEPASLQGWLLTGVYILFLGGVSWTFLVGDRDAGDWFAWSVLVAAASFLFAVTAYRMSASIAAPVSRKPARKRSAQRQQLVLAVSVAAGIMAAAWAATLI